MENRITPELVEKAKKTETAQELIALAQENGIELSREEADGYIERFHAVGELSDEELDNVAGGGCYLEGKYYDNLIVTHQYGCSWWKCKKCMNGAMKAKKEGGKIVGVCEKCGASTVCGQCYYMLYGRGVWYCGNSANLR